jgi:hypothetical protein
MRCSAFGLRVPASRFYRRSRELSAKAALQRDRRHRVVLFWSATSPETTPPTNPLKTGSSASLLAWDKLGRAGGEFISSGRMREDISAFSSRGALNPVRVYVGLRSANSLEVRARLALQELKRVGGFERSVLIVVTPTGTGWVDPAAMDSLEYLHDGAVASVALHYILTLRVGSTCWWTWLRRRCCARLVQGNLRILGHASQGPAAEALSARPQSRRSELRTVDGLDRSAWRPGSTAHHSGAIRPIQAGSGVSSPTDAIQDRPPGFPISRWIIRAVHKPGRRGTTA